MMRKLTIFGQFTKTFCSPAHARPILSCRLTLLFLLFAVFSVIGCNREDEVQTERLLFDLVENFHMADVQQQVSFINFGTPEVHKYMQSGWAIDEKGSQKDDTFVWSIGEKSVLEFFISEILDIEVTFKCKPFTFPNSPTQVISIKLNGMDTGQLRLEPKFKRYEVLLPHNALKIGKNRIELKYAYTRAPIDVFPVAGDIRQLGVAWDYIAFGTSTEENKSDSQVRADTETGRLYIPFGSQVDYYLRLPGKNVLTIESLHFPENTQGELRLAMQREGEEWQLLPNVPASEKPIVISLPDGSHEVARLSFRAMSSQHGSTNSGIMLVKPAVRTLSSRKQELRNSSFPDLPLQKSSTKPNVIIYLIDTLRPDHLGCYGYKKPISPNIDEFAKEATLFENAIAQSPLTRPSTASIFTGVVPKTHKVNSIQDKLGTEANTLAEILLAYDYKTAAFIANPNVSKTFGFDQGFMDFIEAFGVGNDPLKLHEAHKERSFHKRLDEIHEEVFTWLEEKSNEQPFFLYVHTVDPHSPYEPSDFFRQKFAGTVKEPGVTPKIKEYLATIAKKYKQEGRPPVKTNLGSVPWLWALDRKRISVTETMVEHLISLYDAEIAMSDYKFGMFIKELKERKLYDESLIIFVSDHGEEFNEHGYWEHGKSGYGGVLNVPLIVKWPANNSPTKRRIPHLAQHVDILPTILDYLGFDIADNLEGRSLLRIGQERANLYRCFSYWDHRGDLQGASMIEGPWKLIRHWKPEHLIRLYNYETDRSEKVELFDKHPVLAGYLLSLMKSYEHPKQKMKSVQTKIDQDILEKLKALGYLK